MPPSQSLSRRVGIAARWPVGVGLTSWRYLWRITPLHRRELDGCPRADGCPPLPPGVATDEVQGPDKGVGPLFHRRYEMRVREPRLPARELIRALQADLDAAAPREFATFRKTCGEKGVMRVGDEYLVRMAAPWDGPVRVIAADERSFRLATLDGHLEAGQIEFTATDVDGCVRFSIESWARSGDRVAHLLFTHLRMAKEVQLHMWTSYLERIAELAGGRLENGIDIDTRRVEVPADAR